MRQTEEEKEEEGKLPQINERRAEQSRMERESGVGRKKSEPLFILCGGRRWKSTLFSLWDLGDKRDS